MIDRWAVTARLDYRVTPGAALHLISYVLGRAGCAGHPRGTTAGTAGPTGYNETGAAVGMQGRLARPKVCETGPKGPPKVDAPNPYEAPRSEHLPPDDGPLRPPGKRPSRAFIGAMIGPLLGVLFSQARVGSPGLLWWEGKGGETFMTPLGRIIFVILITAGAIVGALCGRVIETRSRDWKEQVTEFG